MISRVIWCKLALKNFSKTTNCNRPSYGLVQICCLLENLLVLVNTKLHSKLGFTYTNMAYGGGV